MNATEDVDLDEDLEPIDRESDRPDPPADWDDAILVDGHADDPVEAYVPATVGGAYDHLAAKSVEAEGQDDAKASAYRYASALLGRVRSAKVRRDRERREIEGWATVIRAPQVVIGVTIAGLSGAVMQSSDIARETSDGVLITGDGADMMVVAGMLMATAMLFLLVDPRAIATMVHGRSP